MSKVDDFINALTVLGDGRYHYWDGKSGIGCSDYIRMALGLAGIITAEEAANPYSLWAAQRYRTVLKDSKRFEELPASTPQMKGDIQWYHGYHVSANAGGSNVFEASPESTHGRCSNGVSGVGLWKNHNYNCSGGTLTCIYRIKEVEEEPKKMIKADTLVKRAIKLCKGEYGATAYRNEWDWNVGKWDGNRWWFDCLGMVHCLVNGFNGTKQLGGGAVMDDFVLRTDEAATLASCTKYGKFTGKKLKKGELLQSSGHVGLYVGKVEVKRSNGEIDVYNVCECTPQWAGGCQLSYVNLKNGYRYNKKGGTFRSIWNYHGELSRVDYSTEVIEEIMPEPVEPAPKATLTEVQKLMTAIECINNKWGVNPERREKLTELYGSDVAIQIQDLIDLAYKK